MTWLLPVAVFLNTFAWSITLVSLPFYVQALGPADRATALYWTGWIMGVTPLLIVATTPLWIALTRRVDPRTSFTLANGLQGASFYVLAAVRSLPGLFACRVWLGLSGPSNTFGLMLAPRATAPDQVRRLVGTMQAAMMTGIMVAPLAGALVAQRFGYPAAFIGSGLILYAAVALVRAGIPAQAPAPRAAGTVTGREVARVCAPLLIAHSQVFFLDAILPDVVAHLGVEAEQALVAGGWLLFGSGAALIAGALVASPLAARLGDGPTLVGGLAVSSLVLGPLALTSDLFAFAALWVLHVLAVAPIFTLVTAHAAQWADPQLLGFIGAARVAANVLAPVLATTLLAWGSLGLVCVVVGGLGLLALPWVSQATTTRAAALVPAPVEGR